MRVAFSRLLVVTGILLSACFCEVANADMPFGNIDTYTTYAKPSNGDIGYFDNFYWFISCYDADNPQILLNCPFTFTVVGLADAGVLQANGLPPLTGYDESLIDGGHTHTTSDIRPLVLPPNGVSIAGEAPTPAGTLSVSGSTNGDTAQVVYPVPQEGGIIAISLKTQSPSGWYCADDCYTLTSWLDEDFMEIGYFSHGQSATALYHVPQSDTNYQVIDSSTNHIDSNSYTYGSYLTQDSYNTLLSIAAAYAYMAKAQLSVNDMSLPVGGLFDYGGHWTPPHHGHRDGVAADINRYNVANVLKECYDDQALIQAVSAVLGADVPHWTKLYCERQWNRDGTPVLDQDGKQVANKHINFAPPPAGSTGD